MGCSIGEGNVLSATLHVDGAKISSIPAGFVGYNHEFGLISIDTKDPAFHTATALVKPGTMRWPGGLSIAYYNTRSGCFDLGSPTDTAQNGQWGNGVTFWRCYAMGPSFLADAVALASSAGAVGLVVEINVNHDSPQNAGAFVAANKAAGYPVLLYELGNEPSFQTCFANNVIYCASGARPTNEEYLTAMKPFADAIHAADPNAKVSITFPSYGSSATYPAYSSLDIWQTWVAGGNPIYWQYVTMHFYPSVPATVTDYDHTPFYNAILYSTTDSPTTAIDNIRTVMTEMNGGVGPTSLGSCMWDATWLTEFAGRVAKANQTDYMQIWPLADGANIGMRGPLGDQVVYDQLVTDIGRRIFSNQSGILPINMSNVGAVYWANPVSIGWSLFSSQAKSSTLPATLILGGPVVDVDFGAGVVAQMAALYATVFVPNDGSPRSVVLSNKHNASATIIDVSAAAPGIPVRQITTVSAVDPFTVHTSPNTAVDSRGNAVPYVVPVVTSGGDATAVLVPANGVVRVDF